MQASLGQDQLRDRRTVPEPRMRLRFAFRFTSCKLLMSYSPEFVSLHVTLEVLSAYELDRNPAASNESVFRIFHSYLS